MRKFLLLLPSPLRKLGVFVRWESPAKRMGEIWGGRREEEQRGEALLSQGSVPAPVVLKNVAI